MSLLFPLKFLICSFFSRDAFKIQFILQGIAVENGHNHIDEEFQPFDNENSKYAQAEFEAGPSTLAHNNNNNHITKTLFSDIIEDNVKHVLDVLPHLGDGFIRKLLSRYDNVEQAIAAVLELNLPPDLAASDQTEVYIPPDIKEEKYLDAGIKRLNIYDGDDYDVMTQDKLKGVVKRGKGQPGQPKDLKALLDDKSHVHKFKSRYQEYSMVSEDPEDDYNDEYDDSFDAMAESETKSVKRFAKNVINDEFDDEESEDSEDENIDSGGYDKSNSKSNMVFCENPEIIRARYEQKRQIAMARKHGGGGGYGGGGSSGTRPQSEIVGKPKGQGQDNKTQQARQNKDVHKSSRANHNRKRGAQFKQSRGMIPM